MAETHVISALVKRRSELTGEIEHSQARTKQLLADLDALDTTIKLIEPDYRIETIKPKGFRPPSDWANRGEMTRVVLEILREATAPLTSQDVAKQLIAARGLDGEDAKLLRTMTKRCGVALRGQRDKGLVVSSQAEGMFMVWRIK